MPNESRIRGNGFERQCVGPQTSPPRSENGLTQMQVSKGDHRRCPSSPTQDQPDYFSSVSLVLSMVGPEAVGVAWGASAAPPTPAPQGAGAPRRAVFREEMGLPGWPWVPPEGLWPAPCLIWRWGRGEAAQRREPQAARPPHPCRPPPRCLPEAAAPQASLSLWLVFIGPLA